MYSRPQPTRAAGANAAGTFLGCLDTALSLDEIYDDVPLPPLEVGEGDDDEWYELDDDD